MRFKTETIIDLCSICSKPCIHCKMYKIEMVEGYECEEEIASVMCHANCADLVRDLMKLRHKYSDIDFEFELFKLTHPDLEEQ